MLSTASTVIEFCTPDTDRLVQCPVIDTVLETPLTLTMLSLQATVRFSLIPATLSSVPGGARGDVDGDGGFLRAVDGPGLSEMLGGMKVLEMVGGEAMIDFTPEIWCAAKAAMPPARATTPMAMTVPRIHQTRLLDGRCGGGPGIGPPKVHGAGGGGGMPAGPGG